MAEKTAQQEFLKDLDIENKPDDILDAPLTEEEADEEKTEGEQESTEEAEMKLKNRRERRLAKRLQSEREANIDLNARYQTLSESRSVRAGTEEAEYLKRVEKIYGDATPEAKEATELLKEALQGVKEKAKQEAIEELEARRNKEVQSVREEEGKLDDIIENLEEEYDVDLTNSADRKGFLTLLEKLSPKDKDGNIIEYADPDSTFELYLSRKEKASTKAKELANRSMVRSGASTGSKLEEDSTVRFLRENGII